LRTAGLVGRDQLAVENGIVHIELAGDLLTKRLKVSAHCRRMGAPSFWSVSAADQFTIAALVGSHSKRASRYATNPHH
jgi:hypothetical protein